jgi:hypothetical protein
MLSFSLYSNSIVLIWSMQSIFTLKEGVKVEDFKKLIDPLRASVISKVPGYHASAWAVDSNNDRKIFLFAGWDSVEVSLVLTRRLP